MWKTVYNEMRRNTQMSRKKSKKQKKVKLPSLPSLRRKALRLWTERVKDLQGNVCAFCGAKDGADNGRIRKDGKMGKSYINAHHVEDKTNYALRWDVVNGVALCPSHHEFSKDSAHRSPVWFHEWLEKNRPGVIGYIKKHRSTRPQTADEYSREEMLDIIKRLEDPVSDDDLKLINPSGSQPLPSSSDTPHHQF
jgi:hypothetical protein